VAVDVTPWWEILKLRSEILGASGQIDDVQMSLFGAVHGSGAGRPPYADAGYYGDITHPTERLTDLFAEIAVRIGGGPDYLKARAVTRLDQGMGGGKSHACVGAYHLATNPAALFETELGRAVSERAAQKVGRELPRNLGGPHVVVLACDNMTPGAPVRELDGPAATLYERFLWRLLSKDYALFERFQPYFSDKAKIAEALRAVERPVLIIVDEVLDYVGNGLDGSGNPELVAQDMAFLRALLDVANDVPEVAMLFVMIAPDRDTMSLSADGRARRDDLNALLERNGTPATVTEVGDFTDILRRRLFEATPTAELTSTTAAAYRPVLEDKAWTRNVWNQLGSRWRERWEAEVAACYPFHPMLMETVREEWGQVVGFQRVRSTIRIFAATVYALGRRGQQGDWAPLLIGPGDLPLGDPAVREALLGSGLVEDDRTIANYRSLAENEVINNDGTGGTARRQDLERESLAWGKANPRAAERAATAMFLASIVGTLRPGRGRGASAPEVKAATSVPNLAYSVVDADTVVEALVNPSGGMSALEIDPGQGNNKPARYYLSTRHTYRMLVNSMRSTITDTERDKTIWEFVQRLSNSGPFRLVFVESDATRSAAKVLAGAGVDTGYQNRLVVLDPAQFSLRNGAERETIAALETAMGLGRGADQLPVQWASSAVFAVVNTQRRANVRNNPTQYLARQKALAAPEVQRDNDLKISGTRELADAKQQLERAIRRAYQHLCYLAQPDPNRERYLEQLTFDDENRSAIDGTIAWKALVERDKVLDAGQFDAETLDHNLRENDYGRTLSEIRSAFYQAPRLPLLYSGDSDLRQAIYDAATSGLLDIVDGAGEVVAVTTPGEVNLASTGLRLVEPQLEVESTDGGDDAEGGDESTEGSGNGVAGGGTGPEASEPVEQQLSFTLMRNLLANPHDADRLADIFRILYATLDERNASYLQGTMSMILDPTSADLLREKLTELGVQPTIKDM
jgi:hypothetical protein